MSDSVPIQWMSQYMIRVAETCGKSFADIETISHSQRKRVQILEQFLTYNPDVGIWGKVSDEEYSISVCFTKDAVSQYVQNFQGRLTEAKHAICYIGQFSPIFVRIPTGNSRVRLSEEPHIALEVGVVDYVDSGLAVLGSPRGIEMIPQLGEWFRELRSSGDGGEVSQCGRSAAVPSVRSVQQHRGEASAIPRAWGPERASPVIASALPLAQIDQDAYSNALKPHVNCQGKTLVGGPSSAEFNMAELADKRKLPPDTVVAAGGSQFCTPPPMRVPQHRRPAGALRVSEYTVFVASEVEATSSAVQQATAPPPMETATPTPLHNVDVSLALDFVSTRRDAEEAADPLENMIDTQKRRANEKTSAVPNDKRNHSVVPDIGESRNDRQRIKKSTLCKPHKKRFMGYQVDFENIPVDGGTPSPLMNMAHLSRMLLQTGRIRTLGDKVTRDGMIYIMSD
ncbi:hypothetical protein BDR05DRAFT_999720 [Suillus weaverae]|nr:hypothetical protein BDR05DRAFT_999720 [Suillus weaverae]